MASELSSEHQKTVLVVDDNDLFSEFACDSLRAAGLHPLPALSLEQAQTIMEGQGADLMLLDIFMQDGDGLDFLEEFKRLYSQVPVLVLTGAGYQESLMQEARKKGAYGFLAKTISIEEIIGAVKRTLSMTMPQPV